MAGFLFSLLAGAAMSIQGVMNTRLGEKVGVLETNAFVQGVGFLLAVIIMWIFGKGDLMKLPQAPWYAWLGGLLAPVITVTVMLWDGDAEPHPCRLDDPDLPAWRCRPHRQSGAYGRRPCIPFTWQKLLGLALMCAGVVLMKVKTE